MKTRKEYLKENWWGMLILIIPLLVFSSIALSKIMDIEESITISLMICMIIYFNDIDRDYTTYRIEELEKQINELKSNKL